MWHRGQQVGLVDVHPVGAVTVGLAGHQFTEMGLMAAGVAQVRMFSDDGICVDDPLVMRRALEYATGLGVLIAQHAEEPRLTVGAVAHEGPNAARLGLSGLATRRRGVDRRRDALLARDAGARVHICHASTAGTVETREMGQGARHRDHRRGHPAPPAARRPAAVHLDGRNRVNPPLRELADTVALWQALAEGVIDCVATDHAPHAEHEKMLRVRRRPARHARSQTALSVVVETMVAARPARLARRRPGDERSPARIVGLPDQGRPLEIGEPANLAVIDPDATWTVTGADAGEPVGQHALTRL